jgi:predicted metal-binding protein
MYVDPPIAFGVVHSHYNAVHGSNSSAERVMLLRVIAIMRQPFGCGSTVVARGTTKLTRSKGARAVHFGEGVGW